MNEALMRRDMRQAIKVRDDTRRLYVWTFTNIMTWAEIHGLYSIHQNGPPASNMRPPYNIAPTQDVHFAHKSKSGELYNRAYIVIFTTINL
jgi:hypothetical protein